MEEVKITASIAVEKGNFKVPRTGAAELKFDQVGIGGGVPGKITIDETETVLDLSALGTQGWFWMKNLSTKHHVEWGPESGGAMVSCGVMEPGEPALYRLKPGVVIRLRVIDQGASGSGSSSSGNATAVVHAMAMED